MIDPAEFIDLVTRMRRAQRDYFNSHNRQDVRAAAITESRRLERIVDEAIADKENGQRELF